jgi:predicted negative regulator of RcsB-dependent stress response
MNKKQLIVLWVMGIIISIGWWCWSANVGQYKSQSTPYLIGTHMTTLIIGGLLIYTLKNKKK